MPYATLQDMVMVSNRIAPGICATLIAGTQTQVLGRHQAKHLAKPIFEVVPSLHCKSSVATRCVSFPHTKTLTGARSWEILNLLESGGF